MAARRLFKRLRAALLLAAVPASIGLAFVQWPVTAGLERGYGLDLLFKLRDDSGTSLVLVTHEQRLAQRGDRQVHMQAGRIDAEASSDLTM